MPQHPTVPRPDPTDTQPTPGAPPEPTTTKKKAADLTVNKVLAGAGAAATTAVLGSFFGAAGTVAGAALGSVASTLASTIYQRSLDRTRDTIVARVRVTPGARTDLADASTTELTVPMPRVSPETGSTRLRVEPALRRPRRAWLWVGVTVLVFVLGLLAVTGIEWAKGSTLTTGETGTSVGRVLVPEPQPDEGTSGADSDTDDSDTGSDGDEARTGSDGGDRDTDGSGADATSTPGAGTSEEPAPTDEQDGGGEQGRPGDEDDGTAGESDPLPTRVVPVPAPPQNG